MWRIDNLLGPLNPNRQAASTAPDPRRIVVFHATGERGSSVCRAFVGAGVWYVTALTRDTEGEVAQELRGLQVDVLNVDYDRESTFEKHVQSADVVFITSDVCAIHDALRGEEPQRTTCARQAAKIQLCKAIKACSGSQSISHVVVCAEEGEDLAGLEQACEKWTIIRASSAFSSVLRWIRSSETGEDTFILDSPVPPDVVIPSFAGEQVGAFVLASVSKPSKWAGKEIHAVSQPLTPRQMAESLSKFSGKRVLASDLSQEMFNSDEHRGKLGGRWGWYETMIKGEYAPDSKASEKVVPEQWDFLQWAGQSKPLKAVLGT